MISYFGLKVTYCLIWLSYKLQACEIWIARILRPFNVKCNFVVDFLLVSNSKCMSLSHGLALIGTWKIAYHLAKIPDKRRENRITSSWVSGEGYHLLNTFMQMSIITSPAKYNQMLHNEHLFAGIATINVYFVRRTCPKCCTRGQYSLNF